jgi:hypothetical protein
MANAIVPEDWTDKDLREATVIEPKMLEEEYIRIPGDLAYWNEQYCRAREGHLRAELAREVDEANLRLEVRAKLVEQGSKVTEGTLDAMVVTDPRYRETREREITADARKQRMLGILDAIRGKREMLVSLGAHIRQEMAGDPSLRRDFRLDHKKGQLGG